MKGELACIVLLSIFFGWAFQDGKGSNKLVSTGFYILGLSAASMLLFHVALP